MAQLDASKMVRMKCLFEAERSMSVFLAQMAAPQKENADQNFDYMFKLLIIGNSSVGKTSFLFRYADDSFTSAFVSTVGIDFKVKTVYKNDKRIKLQIWVSSDLVYVRLERNDMDFCDVCYVYIALYTYEK